MSQMAAVGKGLSGPVASATMLAVACGVGGMAVLAVGLSHAQLVARQCVGRSGIGTSCYVAGAAVCEKAIS